MSLFVLFFSIFFMVAPMAAPQNILSPFEQSVQLARQTDFSSIAFALSNELLILIAICLILLVGAWKQPRNIDVPAEQSPQGYNLVYFLGIITLISSIILGGWQLTQLLMTKTSQTLDLFHNGLWVNNTITIASKLAIAVVMLLLVVYSKKYAQKHNVGHTEGLALILLTTLGQYLLVSCAHFLTLYLGIELISLSLYGLVALRRENRFSTEAGVKYFVLGAMASGFLLFGISFVYGVTGHLDFAYFGQLKLTYLIKQLLHVPFLLDPLFLIGLVFITVATAFKLGAVPFQLWVPDVYEGAPTHITAILATAPKLAMMVMTVKLFGSVFNYPEVVQMFLILAVLSMFVGNVLAISQDNIKRLLAYSGIAQMGFVLTAFMVELTKMPVQGQNFAYNITLSYMLVYVLSNVLLFGLLMKLGAQKVDGFTQLNHFKCLAKKEPLTAGLITVCLLSFAGIPPLLGFFAKLAVLQTLLIQQNTLFMGIAGLAILSSLIGAFVYLKWIKTMYFDSSDESINNISEQSLESNISGKNMCSTCPYTNPANVILIIHAIVLIGLGLAPDTIMMVIPKLVF